MDGENAEGRNRRVVAEVVAGDPDAAEATQDALMAVLAKVSQYDGLGSLLVGSMWSLRTKRG